MSNEFFGRPILNSPYEYPSRHWELDPAGQPTGQIVNERRGASFLTPIPTAKGQAQKALGFDETASALETEGQQYELMALINGLRRRVEEWGQIPEPAKWRVTPETARLLKHWRSHRFADIQPFFCQIEAAEAIIWLTEVAPKLGREGRSFLEQLERANDEANPGLSRLALKLATGAGKTTVMAMLIAWQTVNAVRRPGSPRFTRGFLVVTPGITIRDRLRVLQPNDPDSYYQSRELVPSDMLADLDRAKIVITNYHAFMRRETLSLSKGGRALLTGRGEEIATRETEGQMLKRVMSDLMGLKRIVVLNDEAHHCYREKPPEEDEEGNLTGDDRKEAETNREAARVWISGLETVQAKLGIAQTIDLSATPFFLRGSGYREGTLFPWTVSDFSLMDAIESGIVKLPRVPVADNIAAGEMPRFRNLWHHIGKKMPKRGRTKGGGLDPLDIPIDLQTALQALYGHYAKTFELWYERGVEVPPCFIIVCNNTSTSKLVYDFVSGFERKHEDGSTTFEHGRLALFRNFDETGQPLAQPRNAPYRQHAARIGRRPRQELQGTRHATRSSSFRREIIARDRRPAAGREPLGPEPPSRSHEHRGQEGPPGRRHPLRRLRLHADRGLGREHRHARPWRSGLRHPAPLRAGPSAARFAGSPYHLNEDGVFNVEYADVLGIPFDFTARPVVAPPQPPPETIQVKAISPERDACEIHFPRVQGYRVELPEERVSATFDAKRHARAHARHRRPLRHAHRRNHRRGGRPQPQAPRQGPRAHPGLSPHEAAPRDQVARPGRRPEAAPVRPTEAHHAPVARRAPRVQWRHLPRAAPLPEPRRHHLRSDHARESWQATSTSAPSRRSWTRTTPRAPPATSSSRRRRPSDGAPDPTAAT